MCRGAIRRAIIQESLSVWTSKSVRDYVQMMDSSLWPVDLAGIFTRWHYGDDADGGVDAVVSLI